MEGSVAKKYPTVKSSLYVDTMFQFFWIPTYLFMLGIHIFYVFYYSCFQDQNYTW